MIVEDLWRVCAFCEIVKIWVDRGDVGCLLAYRVEFLIIIGSDCYSPMGFATWSV